MYYGAGLFYFLAFFAELFLKNVWDPNFGCCNNHPVELPTAVLLYQIRVIAV